MFKARSTIVKTFINRGSVAAYYVDSCSSRPRLVDTRHVHSFFGVVLDVDGVKFCRVCFVTMR